MIKLLVRLPRLAALALIFVRELAMSSFTVARDVLRPGHRYRSAIVGVPLDLRDDIQIATLANLITLTPGTTSLLVSANREVLYVHAMDCPSPDDLIASIKEGFETKVRETFR